MALALLSAWASPEGDAGDTAAAAGIFQKFGVPAPTTSDDLIINTWRTAIAQAETVYTWREFAERVNAKREGAVGDVLRAVFSVTGLTADELEEITLRSPERLLRDAFLIPASWSDERIRETALSLGVPGAKRESTLEQFSELLTVGAVFGGLVLGAGAISQSLAAGSGTTAAEAALAEGIGGSTAEAAALIESGTVGVEGAALEAAAVGSAPWATTLASPAVGSSVVPQLVAKAKALAGSLIAGQLADALAPEPAVVEPVPVQAGGFGLGALLLLSVALGAAFLRKGA